MLLIRSLRHFLARPPIVSHFHTSHASWASRKVLQKFKLADIGEGITECEVISWSIKPESKIQAFDLLCEVQSDKASVEITSPFDGVVRELLVKEGEVAKVGQGLCTIEVDEEGIDEADTTTLEPAISPVEPNEKHSKLSPNLQERPESSGRLHPLDPNREPELRTTADVLATPSVRHFARQKCVDLASIATGSGRDGRIEKRDIEAHLTGATSVSESIKSSPATAHHSQVDDVVVDLGRTRYGMWKAMTKSLEIPHFGYSTYLDITNIHHLLPTINSYIPLHLLPTPTSPLPPQAVSPSSLYPAPSLAQVPEYAQLTRLTYLPLLLKTLSKAAMEWPLFRSSITSVSSDATSSKPTLTIRPHADISIALSTPTGLYTPTLQRVNTHSVYSLASQLKHLSHLGRQTPCGLTPNEMPKRGGTLTVSNVGAIGAGESAMPLLVPGGGVAIVAIGRAKWMWDVDRGDGKGERRLKLSVSWSADHRVVEGAELAAFVECWRAYVEAPERLIAEGI